MPKRNNQYSNFVFTVLHPQKMSHAVVFERDAFMASASKAAQHAHTWHVTEKVE